MSVTVHLLNEGAAGRARERIAQSGERSVVDEWMRKHWSGDRLVSVTVHLLREGAAGRARERIAQSGERSVVDEKMRKRWSGDRLVSATVLTVHLQSEGNQCAGAGVTQVEGCWLVKMTRACTPLLLNRRAAPTLHIPSCYETLTPNIPAHARTHVLAQPPAVLHIVQPHALVLKVWTVWKGVHKGQGPASAHTKVQRSGFASVHSCPPCTPARLKSPKRTWKAATKKVPSALYCPMYARASMQSTRL